MSNVVIINHVYFAAILIVMPLINISYMDLQTMITLSLRYQKETIY